MKQAMKQAINPPPARAASAAVPIHEQIYARFRAMIEQGQLCPGQKVSSLRALAIELGVARGTVQVAYDRLLGEGYLEARGPAGTFVSAHVVPARPPRVKHAPATGRAGSAQRVAGVAGAVRQAAGAAATDAPVGVAAAAHRSSAEASAAATAPAATPAAKPAARDTRVDIDADGPALLQLGLPALDAFPRKLWARLMAHEVRKAGSLHKPPAAGYRPLRDALAAYLHRSRGVAAQPEQIFVMPAYTASLALTVDALGLRGASAWVEHPGYPPTAQTLEGAGIDVCRVPVDADGLEVAFGRQRFADARLAVVTPSHQSPMGVALPLQRRIELLDWASESGAWIVEDDYDGEYRYRGHPLPALKSLDAGDNVIYCGTLSKVLYPGLRLSYLVAPHSLVAQFDAACRHTVHGGCP
ncbi:MAG TPA: PLP-dependent aminotransferase family protein, partial [Paraburkholderia sp.]|nr:PLP-dependent aminotransferase family protein [Paraburkholderia sp.]